VCYNCSAPATYHHIKWRHRNTIPYAVLHKSSFTQDIYPSTAEETKERSHKVTNKCKASFLSAVLSYSSTHNHIDGFVTSMGHLGFQATMLITHLMW
jgi:hypothetical protein